MTNPGVISGSETLKLKIDGVLEASKEMILPAGASETVSWTVKKGDLGTYEVNVNGKTGSFTVVEEEEEEGNGEEEEPTPAFILTDLVVDPTTVEPGEEVTVSVTVKNVGGKSGSYTAVFLVDDSKVDEDTVSLVGGASETVEFTGVSGEEGSHTVSVGDLSGSFTVEMPAGGVGPNWGLYAVGGLAILGVAWVVYKQFLES